MAVSIVLIKRFTYRGDANEEWSNRYFLDGDPIGSDAEFGDIVDDLVAQETALYTSDVRVTRAYGYNDDSLTATMDYTRDYLAGTGEVPGTFTAAGGNAPGDVAFMGRWKTSNLTSSGKHVYLRKFWHGARVNPTTPDQITPTQKTAVETFLTSLASGAGVDGRHIRRRFNESTTILSSDCSLYLTTRTLKRRGKRPTSAP